jgi:YhcH/YjgK/YiaL family protein
MIIDRIINSRLYYAVNPRFERAFDYIHQIEKSPIAVGRYEMDNENMYSLIEEYNTKLKEQGHWEAHRRYIDLQYIAQGVESFGYANISHLKQGEYDAGKDFWSLEGEGDFLTLRSGAFILLMPEDAHMSGMALSSPALVRKIVVKIPVD